MDEMNKKDLELGLKNKNWVLPAVIFFFIAVFVVGELGRGQQAQQTKTTQQAQTNTTAVASAPAYKLTSKDFCEERDRYAQGVDMQLLDAGIESTTYATSYPFHESSGGCPKKDNTALVVTYALTGRAAAQQFREKLDFSELAVYGFKKVVLTNGFSGSLGETFTWMVPSCPEDVCEGLSQ